MNSLKSVSIGPLFLAVERWQGDLRFHVQIHRLVLRFIWVSTDAGG